jgi:alpha-L-fucosidase 2
MFRTAFTSESNALRTILLLLLSAGAMGITHGQSPGADNLFPSHAYTVAWNSPGPDLNASMPLGNGDVAANVWSDSSGSVHLYISKSDSWDDNGRLVKVGRISISITPTPELHLSSFSQILTLRDGAIRVRYGTGSHAVQYRLWIDALNPLLNIDVESGEQTRATVSVELWRTGRDTLRSVEHSDPFNGWGDPGRMALQTMVGPDQSLGCAWDHPFIIHGWDPTGRLLEPTVVESDSVLDDGPGRVGWFHRNIKSPGPAATARAQGLTKFSRADPLLHRTFGALVSTVNGTRIDPTHLESGPANRHHFSVPVFTMHPAPSGERWLQGIDSILAGVEKTPVEWRWRKHVRWWNEFWNRSWIHVRAHDPMEESADSAATIVTRGYTLQRYLNACAGRGAYPIKFNGSLFTMPYPERPGNADYRQWGSGYWWQNTRLPYTTMCTAGDVDLLAPLFGMYARDLGPLFRYRTQLYHHHAGIYIPECVYFWGDVFAADYGPTPFNQRTDKLQEAGWHKREWVSGLELVWLMLDYYDHTGDRAFLTSTVLPCAEDVVKFFGQHYPVDASGRLVMSPSQACETWWMCTNPMPEVAGLHADLDRLLALPLTLVSDSLRTGWTALRAQLPPLPTRNDRQVRMLAPAEKFADKSNVENPELYAVFPFRRVVFHSPDRDLALSAFIHREDRGTSGWRQDDVFAAYLGLADTAREYLTARARSWNPQSRFPGFWGPNYDWIPDQDHGSILMKTLQAMILQTDGDAIWLCPAWPEQWDADFRLRAPGNTMIEGIVKAGRVTRLSVTPRRRIADVRIKH